MKQSKTKIDILWLVNGFEGYGISRATQSLANEMRKNGKSIVFVSISNGALVESIKKKKFEVHSLNQEPSFFYKESTLFILKNIFNNINYTIRTYKKLKRITSQYDYQILLYRSPNLTSFASLLPKNNNLKIFLMPNVISSNYFLDLNRRLYLIAAKYGKINIIGNSSYTASTIGGWGIKPYVLHLGVDSNDFTPNQKVLPRERFGIEDNAIVYGVFARLNYDKAQDLVIQAFHNLVEKYPSSNFKLLLIGVQNKDIYYEKCMDLIKSYNLSDKITVLETQNDIVPYYSLVDVMINSRRDAEPFGLTIIESMLMEKPIIALGLGGPAETIIDNHTGWLIKEPSVDAYFKKIELSYLLRDTWPEIGKNGRKHALKNFTTETFLANLMLIIEEIRNQKNN